MDEIEDLTGLDLFHELPNSVEDAAEEKGSPENKVHKKWSVSWELRPLFAGHDRDMNIVECD